MQTGRKILNLRHDRGISQQDLARACEITPSALSKIEAGINSPRAGIIWRIASKLGVTVEFLLDENMPYPHPGDGYRRRLEEAAIDPEAKTRSELTEREKLFIEALRDSNSIAEEIAYSLPGAPVETLRMVHFLIHHSKIDNPNPEFLEHFERLLTTGAPSLESTDTPKTAAKADSGRSPANRQPTARRKGEEAKSERKKAATAQPRSSSTHGGKTAVRAVSPRKATSGKKKAIAPRAKKPKRRR